MRAGFGAATISPSVHPVWLAGFGARTEPASSVRDDLEARAIVIDDVCLVVCDLLGMTNAFSGPIRAAVAAQLGIDAERVLTACTHTHHGPSAMTGTEALGWHIPIGYGEELQAGCVAAARHARESAVDAELRYGRAPLPSDVSYNRRGLAYDAPDFAVLDVVRHDGHRIGVLANLAVHPVALGPDNLAISTDWVGPFRTELERLAGGFAIELSGALGDINPLPPHGRPDDDYEPWSTPDETDQIGRTIADAVAEALDDCAPIGDDAHVVRAETREIALGSTGLASRAQRASTPVDFVEWAIGDVRLVSIPGEAFFALGREIEDTRNRRTLLAGISPSWHGYLPVPWGDGYEEGVSFGPEFVDEVRRTLRSVP
jgi:hypothetical protein